jgi:hypothetical protein
MAQIEEYTPQIESPGPVGGVSPDIQQAGAMGRGLERMGQDISQGLGYIRERTAQQETADVYAQFADQRAFQTAKLQQQTQDGSLDVDQFMQEYDDSTTDGSQNLTTPQGKNFFGRQQARLKGHLLQTAMAGKAQIAARESQGQWQDAVNKNSSVLMQDPTSFEDVHNQGLEAVDQMIQSGGLPEKYRQKAIDTMQSQYAEAALIGYAQQDPAKAQRMLQGDGLGQFLTVQQKEQIQGKIDHYENSKNVEAERAQRAVDLKRKATSDQFGAAHIQALESGTLSQDTINQAAKNGTISWEQADRFTEINKRQAAQDFKADPRKQLDLYRRILDQQAPDAITSQDQIFQQVATGQIPPTHMNSYLEAFGKTDLGKAQDFASKAILIQANQIRAKDPLTGNFDPKNDTAATQFMMDYFKARQKIKAAGGNPDDAANPNSKDYFATPQTVSHYRTNWQDQLQGQAQDRVDKANGYKTTGDNPNPTPVPEAARPGEDPEAYLARIAKKGAAKAAPAAPDRTEIALPDSPILEDYLARIAKKGAAKAAPAAPDRTEIALPDSPILTAKPAASGDDISSIGAAIGYKTDAEQKAISDARKKRNREIDRGR